MKLYNERDAFELDQAGKYYTKHIVAMTKEGLESKGDIAAELGHRDMLIDQLKAQLKQSQVEQKDAVRDAFISGCHCGAHYNVHDWDNQADEYAHKTRQAAKGE